MGVILLLDLGRHHHDRDQAILLPKHQAILLVNLSLVVSHVIHETLMSREQSKHWLVCTNTIVELKQLTVVQLAYHYSYSRSYLPTQISWTIELWSPQPINYSNYTILNNVPYLPSPSPISLYDILIRLTHKGLHFWGYDHDDVVVNWLMRAITVRGRWLTNCLIG